MAVSVDYHLAEMGRLDISDRRNGSYSRHLLTELGDIELHVPRTRRFSGLNVVKAYARRVSHVDQMILDGVVLSRKTGAGAVRRPVLVAMGVRKWVFFPIKQVWKGYFLRSSYTKTKIRESAPLSR